MGHSAERYATTQDRCADDVPLFLEAAGLDAAKAVRHDWGWLCEIGSMRVYLDASLESNVVKVYAFSTCVRGSGIRRTFALHDPVTRQTAAKAVGAYVTKYSSRPSYFSLYPD